ncbi:hypothetical protein ACVDG3_05210 [Meridianimarinicoccus sp. RP-17]|uniref:hypothetical protein n=1 Tax=Meridianimarinicoccus zhengii TaxID=2056810 RepID=UPI001C9B2458|nr:hypothetical protein [Phycocomes zhengii]
MTRLTLCLLATTTLCAPTLALADDPVRNFLSRAAQEVRDSIDTAEARGWRNEARGDRDDRDDNDDDDRDDDDDDDDDDDRGGDDDDDGDDDDGDDDDD